MRGMRDGARKNLKAVRIIGFALLISVISIADGARAERRGSLRQVFARPLIVGASVSGGHISKGPGDVATELVMGVDTAINIAGNGNKARDLTNVDAERLARYSMVIGVDFLFWDSTLADVAPSVASLLNLIRSGARAGIPVLIGNVPRLLSEQKPESIAALNRALYANCRTQRRCFILPIMQFHRQATGPGIVIGAYTYHFQDLTADGLHLNETGSAYVARAIIKILAN